FVVGVTRGEVQVDAVTGALEYGHDRLGEGLPNVVLALNRAFVVRVTRVEDAAVADERRHAANRNQVARAQDARERAEVLHAARVGGIAERVLKHGFIAIGDTAADRNWAPPVVAADLGLQRNVDDVLP